MSTGSSTDVIKDASEFLAYTDKMMPHLALLGTVLGIGDFATATVDGPGSLQTKCIAILSHWLNVTPNPTWELFCDQLEKSDTFNNLRARIAQDHGVSDAQLVSFPTIEEVDRNFDHLTADVNGYIFDLSDKDYSSLHFYCRQRVGKLLFGPLSSDLAELPKAREDLLAGLTKYWNALSFRLLEDVVKFFKMPELYERLKSHTDVLGCFCRMTLGECRKKGIKMHKLPHLKITYQEDPTKFALGKILEFQEFLRRECDIEQSLFEGFDISSVILFFLISRDAASRLWSRLNDSAALSSLGVCRIEFEGLWERSLQRQGSDLGSVMYSQTSSSPEGIKRSRKRSPHHQHGSPSQKRKQSSEDSEESDSTMSSKSFQYKSKKKQSKSSRKYSLRSRAYSDVSVKAVIRCMKRKTLHTGIKKMLTEHRTRLLFDDWELINEDCRNVILGDLEANNITKAANRLIDYFDNNHTGEELLLFCNFLTKEAKDAGRNPQLLKLAKAIKDAVHYVSPGPSGPSK